MPNSVMEGKPVLNLTGDEACFFNSLQSNTDFVTIGALSGQLGWGEGRILPLAQKLAAVGLLCAEKIDGEWNFRRADLPVDAENGPWTGSSSDADLKKLCRQCYVAKIVALLKEAVEKHGLDILEDVAMEGDKIFAPEAFHDPRRGTLDFGPPILPPPVENVGTVAGGGANA